MSNFMSNWKIVTKLTYKKCNSTVTKDRKIGYS